MKVEFRLYWILQSHGSALKTNFNQLFLQWLKLSMILTGKRNRSRPLLSFFPTFFMYLPLFFMLQLKWTNELLLFLSMVSFPISGSYLSFICISNITFFVQPFLISSSIRAYFLLKNILLFKFFVCMSVLPACM